MGAGVEWARATASERARLLAVLVLGLVAALVLLGPVRTAGAADADDGDGPTPVTVRILPTGLEPAMVQIEPGATVTWVNQAGAERTVMATDASFESPPLAEEERFQFAFTEPRTVTYTLVEAPGTSGTITVAGAGAPVATPDPAGDPFGQTAPGATPAQPSGFAYTGSSTAVNGLIGGTVLAIGAGLLYAARRYGVVETLARLTFAPRSDDLLPSRRHRRLRRDQARRRMHR